MGVLGVTPLAGGGGEVFVFHFPAAVEGVDGGVSDEVAERPCAGLFPRWRVGAEGATAPCRARRLGRNGTASYSALERR